MAALLLLTHVYTHIELEARMAAATLVEGLKFTPVDMMAIIRREYLEMPGMRLTRAQFRRLWNLSVEEAESAIHELTRTRFLSEAPDGTIRRLDLR